MKSEFRTQATLFLLRVVAGLLFVQSGGMKLFGWLGGMPPGTTLTTQTLIAGYLEVFGGALFMLGLCTKPVSFILSGMMAVAYFQFHQPNGFWPGQNGGIPAVLYCFLFLFFSANGAGSWSLDARLDKGKKP